MQKHITIVLASACVALAAGVVYLLEQMDTARDQIATESAARQKAETRVKQLETQRAVREDRGFFNSSGARALDGSRDESKAAANERSPPRNYSTGFGSAQAPGQGFRGPQFEMARGMANPGGPRGMANMEMVRSLKLSEADTAKLLKVLTEDQDKFRLALTENEGRPLNQETMEQLRAESELNVHEVLGDAKYQEYKDYENYAAEHGRINRVNTRLTNSQETALTADQQSKLFAVMKEERNRVPMPTTTQYAAGPEFATAITQWRNEYEQRTEQRAATVLTPEQLKTFQTTRGPQFRGPPPR